MRKVMAYILVLVISLQLVACTSSPAVVETINKDDYVSRKEYDALMQKYNATEEKLAEIQAKYNVASANYEEKRAEYDALLAEYETVASGLDEANVALEEAKAALETAKAEFEEMKENYETAQATYNSLKTAYDELKELYENNIGGVVPPVDEPTGDFNETEVVSQLTITRYDYHNYDDVVFLIIENNSKFRLSIDIEVKLYDSNGQMNGYKTLEARPVDKGTKAIVSFSYDEPFANMEYTISAEEEDYYTCGTANLSYTSIPAKDKEIITVTNNGTVAIEFVQVYVLFFKDDEVVYCAWTYFVDDDSELKPGESVTKEIDCDKEYDSILVFFKGRAA